MLVALAGLALLLNNLVATVATRHVARGNACRAAIWWSASNVCAVFVAGVSGVTVLRDGFGLSAMLFLTTLAVGGGLGTFAGMRLSAAMEDS